MPCMLCLATATTKLAPFRKNSGPSSPSQVSTSKIASQCAGAAESRGVRVGGDEDESLSFALPLSVQTDEQVAAFRAGTAAAAELLGDCPDCVEPLMSGPCLQVRGFKTTHIQRAGC